MSTIFPGSASVGQIFDGYEFNGTAWDIIGIDLTADYLESSTASSTYLTQTSASTTYAAKAGLTFTGNITAPEVRASTKLVAQTVGGDEGGEILLGKAATNTTLSGDGVTIDVFQNRLRIFEQGGDARGGYIDVSTLGNGVATNLVPGMTLVKKQTIGSAVTSVIVTNAFSAAYDSYKILLIGGSTTGTGDIILKLGSTTSGYKSGMSYLNYTSVTVNGEAISNGSAWGRFGGSYASGFANGNCELDGPFLTQQTYVRGNWTNADYAGSWSGVLANTTSYTDFTLTLNVGNITGGTIYVYGYNKG
jgi:hypothetical protein